MPYHSLTPSPLASHLVGLVQDYVQEYRPGHQAESDDFKKRGFLEAIERAGYALQSNDRKAKHHWRRTRATLTAATNILLADSVRLSQCRSFDELLRLVSQLLKEVPWVAELYYYDTALSIGANLGLMPDRIYLHAGTLAGAKALGLDCKRPWIDLNELPADIRAALALLSPEEIENFLCIYKKDFDPKNARIRFKRVGCLPPTRAIPTPCVC